VAKHCKDARKPAHHCQEHHCHLSQRRAQDGVSKCGWSALHCVRVRALPASHSNLHPVSRCPEGTPVPVLAPAHRHRMPCGPMTPEAVGTRLTATQALPSVVPGQRTCTCRAGPIDGPGPGPGVRTAGQRSRLQYYLGLDCSPAKQLAVEPVCVRGPAKVCC
jgi:hypothetical protein